jgi:prepilin-type N-terminal cleavage/methylation domain-containing protein
MKGFAPRITLRRSGCAAFTLIELLVVIAIVAALAAVVFGGLNGADKSTSLRSGQAIVANMLAAARSKAMSSGRDVLFLVNDNASDVTRYRRMLAVVDRLDAALVYSVAYLPAGVYVVPHQSHFSSSLIQRGDSWITTTGFSLTSTALSATVSRAVDSGTTESWESFPLYTEGTSNQQGRIVIASGRERSPADAAAVGSPILLESPDQVRGMLMSYYGLARMINDRLGF